MTIETQVSPLQAWIERLRAGDVRTLARTISAVEDGAPNTTKLLKQLFPLTGRAKMLGVTGSPGAGKSTLVDQLAVQYRKTDKQVGIIAVDPTSPYTGGAILGDRIRMQQHHADPGIYIRSMATRGFLGGLSRATADVSTVLDAAGRDVVIIETVGVGQDEVDIVRLADVTVVVLVPGMGDDVQTIKAGIMEIADIFVINKSDREGADRVEREIRNMQTLAGNIREDRWTAPIVKTVASTGTGVEDLVKKIAEYEHHLAAQDLLVKRRASNWRERLVEMFREALLERLMRESLSSRDLASYAQQIAAHERDPYTLVDEVVDKFRKG
ncbi:MAG TPA: methylmalonyl Co-A mutase-associated GTPase MeaB [Terriglobales bacterium]|jgi:LAO/AO transport system kinase